MVYIHNGILLSYKKEHVSVRINEVVEHRAYYTDWSKSEKERQILCINTHIWTSERQYWWSYMQGSNGDTNIKNRLGLSGSQGGMIWKNTTETCPLPYVKYMDSVSSMHETGHPRLVLWDNPEG